MAKVRLSSSAKQLSNASEPSATITALIADAAEQSANTCEQFASAAEQIANVQVRTAIIAAYDFLMQCAVFCRGAGLYIP